MKHKNNITDENYEEVVLRRAINICWALLAIYFIVKIFGGNFFNIVCNNEKFVEFCSYVDNHLWTKIIVGLFSSTITMSFYLLAIAKRRRFDTKEFVIFIVIIAICVSTRLLLDYTNEYIDKFVSWTIDIFQFFILPFLIKHNILKEWYVRRIFIAFVLNLLFQVISMITKNISLGFITSDFLTAIIAIIDLYIMLCLYYLYSNVKKGTRRKTKMGLFFDWLFGKSEAQLSNMKATRLAKIERIKKEIEAIDEEMNKKNESKN